MGLFISPLRPGERIATMSADRLHQCFQETGHAHSEAEDLLVGMLGELGRRSVPKRAGFLSLEHYAKVTGGLTDDKIELALRLDRKLADTPLLREIFQHGKAPPNNLRVLLGVVTPERDAMLAHAVMTHSKAQLEELARTIRETQTKASEPPAPAGGPEVPPATHQSTLDFGVAPPERPVTQAAGDASPGTQAAGDASPPGPTPAPAAVTPCHEAEHAALPAQVQITVRAVTHERLLHEQARLSVVRGRSVSMDEVLSALLDGENKTRSRYLPVIQTTAAGDPVALRTVEGEVAISREDLQGLVPACPPLSLERERVELEAEEGARMCGSAHRSARVDRYLRARSGGRCETRRCRRPGTGVHHWHPRGAGGKDTPSNLVVMCALHMALADSGRMERTQDGEIRVRPSRPEKPAGEEEARARVFQDRYVKVRRWAIERARRRPLKPS